MFCRQFLLLIACFFVVHNLFAIEIRDLRKLYYEAETNKQAAERFFKATQTIDTSEPLFLCYKGVATMMQANYTVNPYKKWAFFREGKTWIEKAISQKPNDIEIRFLRLCIQTNLPSFLGYNDKITADKRLIISNLKSIKDMDLKEKIEQYLAKIEQ